MKITVRIGRNWGNEAIYPVCESAKLFAEIAGTRTLTRSTIQTIKQLGYAVVVQANEVEL